MSRGVAATICTCRFVSFRSFLDQEQVRRLGDGDGQRVADQEQRQRQIGFDIVARQKLDHFGIEQPRFELGVRNAIFGGQAFDDLIFGADIQFDEDLAEQLVLARRPAAVAERLLQALEREIALARAAGCPGVAELRWRWTWRKGKGEG